MRKLLKIIGLGLIGLIVAFIGYVIYGFAFLSYQEDRLTVGCEKEFCIGQSKVDVEAQFENKFSFDSGVMVPFDPTLQPSKYTSLDIPNSFDELRVRDRWTVVYDETRGWQKFVHLKFRDNAIYQIDVIDYGPFYIDL